MPVRPGTVPAISFARVYDGRFPRGEFAGKTVIVGAADSTLGDVHPTPMSSAEMSGPELLANMNAMVLRGIPLRYPGSWVTPATIALPALIVCLAGVRLGTIEVAVLGAGLLVAWSIATQLTFDSASGKARVGADLTARSFPAQNAGGGSRAHSSSPHCCIRAPQRPKQKFQAARSSRSTMPQWNDSGAPGGRGGRWPRRSCLRLISIRLTQPT
jgi:hypothetical protein